MDHGESPKNSLDEILLTEDVVNLAMMSYLDAIQNGNFFANTALVHSYFAYTNNPVELFRDYIPIWLFLVSTVCFNYKS